MIQLQVTAILRNGMDMHANNCAGASWINLSFTCEICKVTPFLDSYDPINEIPVIQCSTVWMSPTGQEYLLVADQFLWFSTKLPNLLLNPNQFHAFSIDVNDNPYDIDNKLGMDCGDVFIPFNMMGQDDSVF